MSKNGIFSMRATAWVAAIGAAGALAAPRLATADSLPVVTNTTEKCGTNTYLKQVTGIGNNPTNLGMHMFVPDKVTNGQVAHPGVLVASHGCDGDGPGFCAATEFAKLADEYGFIVIYPTASTGTGGAKCFEVSGVALTRAGSSDPTGVVSMVDYVKSTYSADNTRVFATGWSSGAMLTNVLLADYPDVFAAGAPFAGVPVSCMDPYPDGGRGNACSAGQVTKSASDWGDIVRAADSGYGGTRPRVQIWHGTSDSVLNFENFGEELKQWSNVLSVSTTQVFLEYLGFPSNVSGTAANITATRKRYGPGASQILIETISVTGADHTLICYPGIAGLAAAAIHFFGLDANAELPTPIVADTQPPTTPYALQASNVTSTGLTLSWSASADSGGVASYVVSLKAVGSSSTYPPITSVSGTTTTTSITNLTPATSYQLWVQAQDKAGNVSSISSTLQVTTEASAGGGGGGGSTGGGGGGNTDGGGGGGCTHGDSTSALALLAMGAWTLLRGKRRAPIGA